MDKSRDVDEHSVVSSVNNGPSRTSSTVSFPLLPPSVLYNVTSYNNTAYNPGAIPKIPLRVPQKRHRQSSSPTTGNPGRASCEPSSPVSTIIGAGEIPPPYKAESVGDGDDALSSPAAGESDEERWFAQRDNSRRFLIIVGAVTVVLLLTLAFGLPLGLRNKVSTQGGQAADGIDGPGIPFPAGSFAFSTSLQRTDAGCTSKNTTWRCDPIRPGDSTTFYWDIAQINYYTYTITSSDNAFAPGFSNISMKLRDYNKTTERLEFSFLMNKTVIPSDAGAPTDRAAKCTYVDTTFQTTLYTRQRGNTSISAPEPQHVKYSAWPGGMEIVQSLASTIGQPVCKDAANTLIADVGSGPGTCMCQYTNINGKRA